MPIAEVYIAQKQKISQVYIQYLKEELQKKELVDKLVQSFC